MEIKQELIEKIHRLSKENDISLVQKTLKGSEEMGELAQAVLAFVGSKNKSKSGGNGENVLEESVDLFAVLMDVVFEAGYTTDDFNDMLELKLIKWENKNRIEGE